MKPGQYVLAHDVTNPKPDRRQRHDWRAKEVWYHTDEFTIEEASGFATPTFLIRATFGRWTHQCLYLHMTDIDPRIAALTAALVPAPRNGARDLKAAFAEGHNDDGMAWSVIVKMLDTKVIDIDQVRTALAAINAEYDEKEA